LTGFRNQVLKDLKRHAPLQLRIIKILRDELAEDAIVVSGVTNVGYWSSVAFKVLKPRTYITSSHFVTLGFAFPTALGAKIGNPDKQVVALCGDGGFMYSSQEIATAVKEKLSVVAIVFNDKAFGASLSDQMRNYGDKVIGTRVVNPDFPRLAQAFGARGIRISRIDELRIALKSALQRTGPTIIEVPMPTLLPPFQI